MKYTSINAGYGYVARLEKGESVRETLLKFAEKEDIRAAYFFAIGSIEAVKIGYYDLENQKYIFSEPEGKYEVASLQGNIGVYGGKPSVHMHAVLSEANKGEKVIAGHLDDARVAITLEVFIHLLYGVRMKRALDKETGLPLLEF